MDCAVAAGKGAIGSAIALSQLGNNGRIPTGERNSALVMPMAESCMQSSV